MHAACPAHPRPRRLTHALVPLCLPPCSPRHLAHPALLAAPQVPVPEPGHYHAPAFPSLSSHRSFPTHSCPPPQVPVPEPGRYRVALDSDAWDFGGPGRVGHDVDHFSTVGLWRGPSFLVFCHRKRYAW